MAEGSHGHKHQCASCGCKFYDMNRPMVLCPRCGSDPSDAPEKPDIIDIAAKVLAATVTDTEEPTERYGPVADEMDVFDDDSKQGAGKVPNLVDDAIGDDDDAF